MHLRKQEKKHAREAAFLGLDRGGNGSAQDCGKWNSDWFFVFPCKLIERPGLETIG